MKLFNKAKQIQLKYNKHYLRKKQVNKGFSLLEAIITIAIIAILTTLTTHALTNLYRNYHSRQFTILLWQALKQQPKYAMNMQQELIMRPVNNNWLNGWQVFVDANNNQMQDANEATLEKLSNNENLSNKQINSTGTFSCFRFAPSGIIRRCGANPILNHAHIKINANLDGSCEGAYKIILYHNRARICNLQGQVNNCDCN